eukprot:gene16535-biopygen3313
MAPGHWGMTHPTNRRAVVVEGSADVSAPSAGSPAIRQSVRVMDSAPNPNQGGASVVLPHLQVQEAPCHGTCGRGRHGVKGASGAAQGGQGAPPRSQRTSVSEAPACCAGAGGVGRVPARLAKGYMNRYHAPPHSGIRATVTARIAGAPHTTPSRAAEAA